MNVPLSLLRVLQVHGRPRRRRMASLLRARFVAVRQPGQRRWIGDVRSTTRWHRSHSMTAWASQARDRSGWGSGISVSAAPRDIS